MPNYYSGNPLSPSEHIENVTPNDSADLPYVTRQIRVGSGGALKVKMYDPLDADTDPIIIPASVAEAGAVLDIAVTRIYDTDTDASNIVAFY